MKTQTTLTRIFLTILLIAGASLFVNAQCSLNPSEQLGKEIYFDKIASPDNLSCADCHGPNVGFTGPIPGINNKGAVYPGAMRQRFGNRKPPSAAYATLSPIFDYDETEELFVGGNFWDGRATGARLLNPAAEQALGPFLNPVEQNVASKQDVLIQIAESNYAWLWEVVWGEALDPYDLDMIDANYDKIGLTVAAYENSCEVNAFTSKFDYVQLDLAEFTEQEQRGLELFEGKGMCSACHPSEPGPFHAKALFTDFTFDNLGTPKNPNNPFYEMDEEFIIVDGVPVPINPEGEDWIDPGLGGFLATVEEWEDMATENMGKHKVPTLRNVDKRPGNGFIKAYMHNGVFKSLKEVVHFYNTRDVDGADWPPAEVNMNINTDELGNLGLTDAEEDDIVAFMKTLSDGYKLPKAGSDDLLAQETTISMTCMNPVSNSARIMFELPESSNVVVEAYNLTGQKVMTLYNDFQPEGSNTLNLPAESLLSGIYIIRLQACNQVISKKITVVN
jgi:cytochrome c peroxidase